METTYKKLLEDMEHVAELNHERDEAKKKGQKKSKTKEALKELAVALSPLNKAILKSASAIEDRAKQFLGQVSKLESKADDVVGEINKAVALLNGLPDRMMSVAQTAAAAEMNTKLTELMKGVADMHRRAQNAAGFGDRCLKAIKKLRKEDSWSAGLTADVGGVSNKAVVLFALANFIFEAAKHGKSLIPI
jgi:chromosome segregation ATPase